MNRKELRHAVSAAVADFWADIARGMLIDGEYPVRANGVPTDADISAEAFDAAAPRGAVTDRKEHP